MDSYSLNFYPSAQEVIDRTRCRQPGAAYGGFGKSNFTVDELAQLKAAIAAAGGVLRFLPGGGPGRPGTIGVRGITYPSARDAEVAGSRIISQLPSPLGGRLQPSARISPKKWGG